MIQLGKSCKGDMMAKKKCSSNPPHGPENGYPDGRSDSVGKGKKTSTKLKGFK